MSDYVLRSVKGSPLTHNEVDNNFINGRTASRLSCASVITPSTGVYINQNFNGSDMGSLNTSGNCIFLTPFYVGYDFQIDEVGVWQTGPTSVSLRILIYSVDANGWPGTKLLETGTISTATGANTEAVSFTFSANTLYWVGTHTDGTETFRSVDDASLLPLGIGTGLNTTGIANRLTLNSVSIGSAPATWTPNTNQLDTGSVVSIGFRAA